MKRFPLSAAQQVVWLHEQRWPGSSVYHFTARLDLSGRLDVPALRSAIGDVVAQHGIYRTALVPECQPPAQVTVDEVALPWREVDWRGQERDGSAFDDLLREHIQAPFDLYRAPLARWTLVRFCEHEWCLLHTENHLIHDGQSYMTFLGDLSTAYAARVSGRAAKLTEAPAYAEYVLAMAQPDSQQATRRALDHWRQQLDGASWGTTVPTTRRRGGGKRFAGAQWRHRVAPELALRIRQLGQCSGTPFGLMLGVFGDLIRRYTGQQDVVVGSTVGNRPPGFEDTAGMFVNTLPIRLDMSVERCARELCRDGALALLTALRSRHAPIQEITREVGASGSGADNPLFRIMFSAHDTTWPELNLPDLRCKIQLGLNLAHARMDIDVVVIIDDRATVGSTAEGDSGMTLLWDYDTDRYNEDFIKRMAERYVALLTDAVAEPDRPLRDTTLTSETPAERIGDGGPGRTIDLAPAGDPEAPAIYCGTTVLTYAELDERVTRLARRLDQADVRAGDRVAAILPRGIDAVLTLLACLRLRAVWCPVPANAPAQRRERLIDRLRPAATVRDIADALIVEPAAEPGEPLAGDAAYVMHTSGSTGLPKAVVVDRGALENHVAAVADAYALDAGDRVLQFAQPHFDVVLEEILPTLCRGGALVIPRADVPSGADLAALLLIRGVTVANLPTSYLASALTEVADAVGGVPLALRMVVIGGERGPATLSTRIRDLLGAVDVRNAYGVTEATVTTTVATVTGADHELTIGHPLPGTRVYLLDEAGRPLPTETVGEIAVGGAGVARGYLDDQELTASRFRADPLGAGRVYRTGDLGYWRADGELCFLGRRDNQVKFHGYRIELEEIESAIGPLVGGVRRAVVLDEDYPESRLVAFVESAAPMDTTALTRALAGTLPATIIPRRWVVLPALPSVNGDKVDRRELRKLLPQDDHLPTVAPNERCYPAVRAVWEEVLGRSGLTPEADFFQLGGHSLLAIQITARLRASLGREVPLGLLFDHPVLADFAAALTPDQADPVS